MNRTGNINHKGIYLFIIIFLIFISACKSHDNHSIEKNIEQENYNKITDAGDCRISSNQIFKKTIKQKITKHKNKIRSGQKKESQQLSPKFLEKNRKDHKPNYTLPRASVPGSKTDEPPAH
jgi:hypothetical protein